ncbi:MAG: 4-hydroxy-tetrahydrodipicolinate reductase [Planctomycetota bacterium]
MSDTPRVLVRGARGRMGQEACAAVEAAPDLELAAGVDLGDDLEAAIRETRATHALDMTRPEALDGVETMIRAGLAVVVGTSGVDPARRAAWAALAEDAGTGVLVVPNFCIGVVLMQRFAEQAVRWLPDVEILELHHEQKVDSPSGTAAATAERLARSRREAGRTPLARADDAPFRGGRVEGIPVHSIRLPGLLAHQVVQLGAPGEVLSIRHDTLDRKAFMPGILLALRGVGRVRGLELGLEVLLEGLG